MFYTLIVLIFFFFFFFYDTATTEIYTLLYTLSLHDALPILFDWLQAAEPKARALSVSRKDRGAILPVGRARQQVYWYQGGIFTTSRYYADSLPAWVQAFNARRIPFRAAGRAWTLLLPASAYAEPDSVPYENLGHDFTFPHELPVDSAA